MQLLMARLDGAAPNSPEADAALHKLLPQALRDEFAAEDVFELLAAMQLLLGGGGRRFEPAAVLAALPERLKVGQGVQRTDRQLGPSFIAWGRQWVQTVQRMAVVLAGTCTHLS
jgi:hypothetical protein